MPELHHVTPDRDGYEPVDLPLAQSSADLWPAIEAAQFAHIVNRDPPDDDGQDRAMRTFVAIFAELAESWESVPIASRMPALDGIERYLVRMRDRGIYVHAGAVECAFTAPGAAVQSLPLAVLNLGGDRLPVVTLMIPHAIDVTGR